MDAPLDWGREVRGHAGIEIRRTHEVDHLVTFRGYAAVWDVPYEPYGPVEDGGFSEVFRRDSFKRTLGRPRNRALLDSHNNGRVIATTGAGNLTLTPDSIGLLAEATLDTRVSWINDLALQVEDGTIGEMSHAFRATKGGQTWNKDFTLREITDAELFEVSVLWAGANPTTHGMIERTLSTLAEVRGAQEGQNFDRVRIAATAALATIGR